MLSNNNNNDEAAIQRHSGYEQQDQDQDQQQQQDTNTIEVPTPSDLHVAIVEEPEFDEASQPCFWWLRAIPAILFISFLIGVTIGTTSAIIPELQSDTFGNNSFIYVGSFGGGKGLLALAYTPIVGSLSDEKSRFYVLISTMVLSLIPWAAMTIFDNFWIYTIANCMFGLYSISFTMLVVCIVARVPQVRKSRTLALSCNVAIFLVGVAGASFLGPIFSEKMAFAISLLCQFVSLLAAYFFLRKNSSINSPNKYFHLVESGSSASGGSAGVLANESTSLLKKQAVVPQSPKGLNVKSYSLAFHIARAWKVFVANRNIKILFLVAFFNYLTSDMLDQMLLLYLQESLSFSDNDMAYTIAVMSVASIMFVIFIAATRDYISDTAVLRMALFSSFVMTCLYAVVTNTLFAIMLPAVNMIGMAALPAVSSLTVDSVSPAEIGVGQGLVQAARVAAGAICPFLYGWLFQISWDSDTSLQGWPFFVAAGCIGISILITFALKIQTPSTVRPCCQ